MEIIICKIFINSTLVILKDTYLNLAHVKMPSRNSFQDYSSDAINKIALF